MSDKSKKKNIAFILPSLQSGGAERVVSNLSNNLIHSFDISLIVFYKSDPFYGLHPSIKIYYCLNTYNPTPKLFASLWMHLTLFRKTVILIKSNDISTVIGFMTTANVHAILASIVTKAKSIISERAHPEYDTVNATWHWARRKLYPKSNKLVLQTNAVKSYYTSFVSDSKLEVIRNPISKELLKNRDSNIQKENSILSVGRLDDGKNHALLIKAFSAIQHKHWTVKIIGDGPNKEALQDLINSLGLSEKITMVGSTQRIYDYYNKAAIFVFTSKHEGFPNALIEAMHFNLACISTDCPYGPSELINEGINGFLIPIDDQIMLEERLATLIQDEALREKLQINAAKDLDHFNEVSISKQWQTLIETC
jgi:GalNAc-alpha-(1->4)-GalNAc-alpha-(1->3)-diNAcBac-PP-undecaprenol alpha-1,4-N-acetyl-D-galactosaminyltransferase